MNSERGVSSLAMVLLLLVLGSLLLQGVSRQETSFASRVTTESRSLQRQAVVQSAIEWGRMQSWGLQPALQCRRYSGQDVAVCLRRLTETSVLLIAHYEGVSLWRQGAVIDGNIEFSAHGWSDFCPLKAVALCLTP
ncbi:MULTISPECIES: DUF2509 family protein [Citrobacter]|mgnify:FL=1|uniref:Protein of uncharacterized function (DUF2509) n=2 Tax=Citrobacter freundii complex TaxID=1344959 RepID=A0A9N8GR33_9ENTR|nr:MULTISPECIES: DUF2509 family protein [Citrobacter]AWS95394.1 DUF2509 domain-containing protein [Citrobacter sp. CRE-46]MBJ8372639.1 DUF2509 family protein [Citrobacter cronae]MBJ8386336.1 DUF2509 family protein [Citrobacter cronae]MBJ8388888.1 DUF2509 family protein [Citrobacter cronae]MBX8968164.1 DUF2509 family protein [Citrobacter werkmanii]